jgi:hypothetical protein
LADRTEELRERVAGLDSRHDEWLRKMQCAFGRMLVRSCRFRVARWFVAGPFARMSSYFIVERGMCGVESGIKKDPLDIATEWLKIPTFIRMPYRIAVYAPSYHAILFSGCSLLALDGPHSDRPWAAMLRELGHLTKFV